MSTTALVWFRVDLRTRDNAALFHAARQVAASAGANPQSSSSRLLAVFLVTPREWRRHDVSPARVDFMLRAAADLSRQLWHEHRVPLLVRHVPDAATSTATSALTAALLAELCKQHGVTDVHWNTQLEVDEAARDEKVSAVLSAATVRCHPYDTDQCVVRPGTLLSKSAGTVYTIYTPFKRAWMEAVKANGGALLKTLAAPTFKNAAAFKPDPDVVPASCEEIGYTGWPVVSSTGNSAADNLPAIRIMWPATEHEAQARLTAFTSSAARLSSYKDRRDFPATRDGTSSLSAYLASGLLSGRQCVEAARDRNNGHVDSGSAGAVTWIQELAWRDFYRHILVAFPHVCKRRPFKRQTESIQWRNNNADFDAWCRGRTGYPIVDAAMRQMLQTGWMHNRARMIVASFLSKHLLHDWRDGERFFMRHLIDGDFASNNGGWQWAASTGTDSQPYFRVFNPHLQSERFDPDGTYIREYVPELRSVTLAAELHYPLKTLGAARIKQLGYAVPIVEHVAARQQAIDAFKQNAANGNSENSGTDNGYDTKVGKAGGITADERKVKKRQKVVK